MRFTLCLYYKTPSPSAKTSSAWSTNSAKLGCRWRWTTLFLYLYLYKTIQHCICICIWSTICEIWLPMEVNRYKSIYPFQRHDLPPTLDIITHNFPKFPNFSTRKLCEIGLPIEVNRYQKKQSSPQIYVTFGTLKHPKWSFFINVYWLKYNTSRTIS